MAEVNFFGFPKYERYFDNVKNIVTEVIKTNALYEDRMWLLYSSMAIIMQLEDPKRKLELEEFLKAHDSPKAHTHFYVMAKATEMLTNTQFDQLLGYLENKTIPPRAIFDTWPNVNGFSEDQISEYLSELKDRPPEPRR